MATPVLFYATIVIALMSWVVALGGLSALAKDCKATNTVTVCAVALQRQWWAVWFEFVILVSFVTLRARAQLAANSPALLSFLAIVTSVLMSASSDVMLSAKDMSDFVTSDIQATAAGLVMLCVVNCVLIVMLGSRAGNSLLGIVDGSRDALAATEPGSQDQSLGMTERGVPGSDSRHEMLMAYSEHHAQVDVQRDYKSS